MKLSYYLFLCIIIVSCTTEEEDFPNPKEEYPIVLTREAIVGAESVELRAEIRYKGDFSDFESYGFEWRGKNGDFKRNNHPSIVINGDSLSMVVSSDMRRNEDYSFQPFIQFEGRIIYGQTQNFISQKSAAPVLHSVSPTTAYDGDTITLVGEHLTDNVTGCRISINSFRRTDKIIHNTTDTIIFVLPNSNYQDQVRLGVFTSSNQFASIEGLFVYGPTITSISTNQAYAGDTIQLYGTHFTGNGEDVRVRFGSVYGEVVQYTDNFVEVIVPPVKNNNSNSPQITLQNGSKSASGFRINVLDSWRLRATPPFNSDRAAIGFSYEDSGYTLNPESRQMYLYDPLNNRWNILSTSLYPDLLSNNFLFFQHEDRGVMLDGLRETARSYFIPFNIWNGVQNSSISFRQATAFVHDGVAYITTDRRGLWTYTFRTETFTRLNNISNFDNSFLFAFQDNEAYYLLTDTHTWQFDWTTNTWLQLDAHSLKTRHYALSTMPHGFSHKGKTYIIDLDNRVYLFEQGNWRHLLNIPIPSNAKRASFTLNDIAYVLVTQDVESTEIPALLEFIR